MLLLIGSFIAGMLTVLAPCILALLPLIIGGSISGNTADKKRPIIIALSLATSLFLFTLLLKATTLFIAVPPQVFTYISGGIIIILGVLTLFPMLYARFIALTGIEHRAQSTLSKGYKNTNQYIGPILIGAALGPVFSSCSPVYAYILATILPVNFLQAIVYILVFILGLTIMLLLIGYFGQRFVARIKFASNPKGWFQRTIAILFILLGIFIITGYDKRLQTYISAKTPLDFDSLSIKLLPGSREMSADVFNVKPYAAPEFKDLEGWINSEPLSLAQLKGKTVLVDFWTYSCINCIRNNPYLNQYYEKYKNKEFVVVGLHAPEFSFERDPKNVAKAVRDQNLTYPVALDNKFNTWSAFKNRSWPALYLIDAQGNVRRIHEGEGQYIETDAAIRQLLQEDGQDISGIAPLGNQTTPYSNRQTPETYLGTRRLNNFVNDKPIGAKPVETFTAKTMLSKNQWTLGGTWRVGETEIMAEGNSSLVFNIAAKDVYLVMGADTPQQVTVNINGQPITAQNAGSDVMGNTVTVGEYKLYRLVSFPEFTEATLELKVPNGVKLNAFTFGS